MIRRFPVALFLLMALLLPVVAFAQVDDSVDLKDRLLEHRRQEAANKAAVAKAWAATDKAETPNQAMYNVHHYFLDLDLNTASHILSGVVTVTAEVTGASITTLDLDLKSNMTVLATTSGMVGVTFSRASNLLTVNLDRTYTTGETVVVGVQYSGNPAGAAFGWSSYGGQDMIWTLSEPYGARDWWPCKDLNHDKADSVDIEVTVPDHLVVASNGLLESEITGGGTNTYHWKSLYPIPTYLVSLAIHPYERYTHYYVPLGGGDPMDVQYFVYPGHWATVEPTYDLTVPMIGTFAQAYGEYPFVDEKYGHAEFTWGGGMEHQTITSMGDYDEDLISHELAHQWWGDMITCEDFHHIWLNEGFATWSEAYWKEQTAGFATYQNYMDAAAFYGPGTIFVEDPNDFGAIFDPNLSYNKGSWIVHMLRGVLGDTDFFAGIDLYRANHIYSTATTEDLQAAMETVSGLDLTDFFQQWIYGEYFPVYAIGWTEGPGAGEITVTIDQVQDNTGLFTMSIQLRVTTDQGAEDFTVQNSLATEQYVLQITGTPEGMALDPDRWILRLVESQVTNPTFDKGILLVNGVHWDTYGAEITSAYDDSTFWGDNEIDFWDCFAEPGAGYPASLPAPLGHGTVPAEFLGGYSTVIWVGNNYSGDLPRWAATPITSYLETGGNVLLMTRRARSFVEGDLTGYLGVTWAEADATLGNYIAQIPGLTDQAFIGDQSWNDVFYIDIQSQSTLLFTDTVNFSQTRGLGVWADPGGVGTFRAEGGQFVLLDGRPYCMDHASLRSNVEFILSTYLGEPYTPVSAAPDPDPLPMVGTALGRNHPNPFNPRTTIVFDLARSGPARLNVYDMAGRHVRTLVDEISLGKGRHEAVWDGRDTTGREVSAGVYFYNLRADGFEKTHRMTLVK